MRIGTHEQTINTAVAEVLTDLSQSWRVQAEKTGKIFLDGGRPDVLIEEPAGWPVVIEAEVANHRQAEIDAETRLGKRLAHSPRSVETAVALVYPEDLRRYSGRGLRDAIRVSEFEYIVLGSDEEGGLRDDTDRPSRATHSRIDDGDVDRPPGEGPAGGAKGQSPAEDILGRDVMGDVDNTRVRVDGQDGAFHGAHVSVTGSKIRGQGYTGMWRHGASCLRSMGGVMRIPCAARRDGRKRRPPGIQRA